MTSDHHADLLLTNARIWTGDPGRPSAQALAVRGGRILAIGTAEDVAGTQGSHTRVIDAGGRFLMPGFNDAHVHVAWGGAQLESVQLRDARTPDEFRRRLAERARMTERGEWITGGEWDEQQWPEPALPTRTLVDEATQGVPLFITRYDWHMALANSEALRRAGISATTPDPAGGVIVRDDQGNPTGILKDAAMALVASVVPPPTPARRERTLRRALRHMASLGVTSAQDMGPGDEDRALCRAFAERGELTARIRAVPLEHTLMARGLRAPTPHDPSAFFRESGAKGFADGSLGSTTAYFFEPYADAPDTCGLLSDEMQPVEGMRSRLTAIDAAGEPLCIHAIGDRAVSIVLDLFADVTTANGRRDRRPRIEHSQHVRKQDLARYRELGVIASVQPYHAIDDGKWAERRIGAGRLSEAFPWRSFLEHGVPLALGTDWPVAPLDPMATLDAAVRRATLDGKHPGGWVPEQRLSVAEALTAYTAGSAFAEFTEGQKGVLAPGRLADVVLLSDSPFGVPADRIRELRVELTVVGGTVIFEG